MTVKLYVLLLFLICGWWGSTIDSVQAQESPRPGMYVIFDGSNSMWGALPDSSRKIAVAKQAVKEFLSGEFEAHDLALRVYGHRKKGDCRDSELVIPFGASDDVAPRLQQVVEAIVPRGKTPISYSLREALKDFGNRPGAIILITDGIETCDVDPCALLKEWKDRGVTVNVHVVGLGIDEKSKPALQCMADAADTKYYDAHSMQELVVGLAQIKKQLPGNEFRLRGKTKKGNPIPVFGFLQQENKKDIPIKSNGRFVVDAGTYTVIAGAQTRNGDLYHPMRKQVTVRKTGATLVEVQVEEPPTVKAIFMERGKIVQPQVVVHAFQKGKEVFAFRGSDEVYVNEGSYEFRARPNQENNLSVNASVLSGDQKEILFTLAHTVRLYLTAVDEGTHEPLQHTFSHFELWQHGKKKYSVSQNGALVLPGTYDAHLQGRLISFVTNKVAIADKKVTHREISVPVGYVTVRYQHADGTPDTDERCFIGKGATGHGSFFLTGWKIPALAGTYNVAGWTHKGKYARQVFTIEVGKEKEIILRPKQ